MKYIYITLILLFTSCSNNELKFTQQQIDQLFKSKNLGLAYIEESKLEDAEKEFEKILNINPNEAMGYGNLALIYFRLGQLDKAKLLIKKSESLSDENPDIKLINSEILIANIRHAKALKTSLDSILKAEKCLHDGSSGEIISYELRDALESLGSITGEIIADDLLSSVFSRFCIGK